MSRPGLLIVFEGIDGTGKSTQTRMLRDWLRDRGHRVVLSREPTGGAYGTRLRESAKSGRLSPEEELQLFLQDRREHVETLIEPALEAGEIVILDRYYFSTMAYQGVRGFDPAEIRRVNEEFAPLPDLLLVLDLDLDVALERIGVRDGELNAFEQRESLRKCQEVFQSLKGEPFCQVIDAGKSLDEVAEAVREAVGERLRFD